MAWHEKVEEGALQEFLNFVPNPDGAPPTTPRQGCACITICAGSLLDRYVPEQIHRNSRVPAQLYSQDKRRRLPKPNAGDIMAIVLHSLFLAAHTLQCRLQEVLLCVSIDDIIR